MFGFPHHPTTLRLGIVAVPEPLHLDTYCGSTCHLIHFSRPCVDCVYAAPAQSTHRYSKEYTVKLEAATARSLGPRDRFGGFGEPATTPLQRYILNACDPQNFEPNLALNLEIADLINAKKGSAPREAAVAIVTYINHRNPNVSLLALALLDICVKNCGYPFHLQISTKEFLNELVRRFPERPPVHPSRVQSRILELIEEWRATICQTSRYKEDLGHIRDMHRLLSYKGYVFPEVRREDAAVLNPTDNLRSAEEMEEEERAAQSAKLQELIRRGSPQDLQEANRLMKVMAGYDTRNKTDYRAKAAEEVSKVQQKAKLLEDMLQRQSQGQPVEEGDVFEDLANALMSAHPKIQKMCEEESDDHEAVAKLLEINDSIHRTIERYKLIKKGDVDGANKIPKGTLGTSGAGVKKGPDNELSLIDFGGPEDELPTGHAGASADASGLGSMPAPAQGGNSLENDLLGLSIGENFGQGGGISLGLSDPPPTTQPPQRQNPMDLFNQPTTQSQQASTAKPNYTPFGAGALGSSALSPPAMSSVFGQQPASTPQPAQAQQQAPRDPFASLSKSATPRTGSPFQFQQSVNRSASPALTSSRPVSTSNAQNLFDLGSSTSQPASQPVSQLPQTMNGAAATNAAGDDEWTFSSSLPEHDLVIVNSSVEIKWAVSRPPGEHDVILIKSLVYNKTPAPITDFTFQVAVTKSYTLQLEPQSARRLPPNGINAISQVIRLRGVEEGKGNAVKMRWKASYSLGSEHKDESGEISSLGIS